VLYLDEGLTPPSGHGFSIAAVCLQPRSVGKLTLRSSDPLDHPDIDPAFATDPEDVRVLMEGVKQMRSVVASPPLSGIAERERGPGAEDAESWIRNNAHTIYHPVGTCSLGRVVDDQLRVIGVEGVRVVDASVIPNLMRGHPHPQVSMVALRGTELSSEQLPNGPASRRCRRRTSRRCVRST
jgi:choline dehydrogenase